LLGGAYGNHPYTDGFTSEDGFTWDNLDASEEGFPPNFNQEQSAAILNDALYIIGQGTSKWTQDGKQWYPLTQEMSYDPEPFSYTGQTVLARAHHTATAFKGRLWITGQYDNSNDIWVSAHP
jgi:hypothetical protein